MCCSLGRGMIDRFKADGVEWSGGQVTAQDDLFFPKLTRTADKTLFPVFTHPSCLFQVYARAQPAPSDSVWGWCITAHWHWCVPGGSGAEDKGRAKEGLPELPSVKRDRLVQTYGILPEHSFTLVVSFWVGETGWNQPVGGRVVLSFKSQLIRSYLCSLLDFNRM